MKVLKFGGKSLANGKGLETVLSIITDKVAQGQEIAVVVSARDKATDQLESMLERAARNTKSQGRISISLRNFLYYNVSSMGFLFWATTMIRSRIIPWLRGKSFRPSISLTSYASVELMPFLPIAATSM